ncbi:pseudouridine synthase [Hyphomonas sp.]|jgi:23S rRNA pseudouridine2604 synthase|uniref:pseudouridine synthase n=1 Tax=Hyphomonas sp. TaxID=87 RepID=UPI00356B4627
MAWTKTYSGTEPMRVNKWLATEGVCSRREADALIEKGLVKINGEVLTEAGYKIEDGQTLTLTEKAARRLDNQLSLMFHKPVGIVSGTPEPGEIPAVRLINEDSLSGRAHAIPGRNNRLAPLGRLDKDSHGLLILSEDGVLAKALIGPESKLEKEYHVKVRGDVTEDKLTKLRHGLELDGRQLRPADVTVIKGNELKFILREGRNRQIRRMCDLVELRVIDLIRTRIGPLSLAGLPEGKWRPISGRERDELLRWEVQGFSAEPAAPVVVERKRPLPAGKRPTSPGKKPMGKPRGDGAPAKPKPADPKFKRTKLAPRKRTPIK